MKEFLIRATYHARNWRTHYRELVLGTSAVAVKAIGAGGEGAVTYRGVLSAKIIRDPRNKPTSWFKRLFWVPEINLGILSRRVVTTVGVRFLCDDFNAGGTEISNMKYHAWGTGTNAEAASDTTLQTESTEARTAGSQASATSGANATYTTVGTITATGTRAITEHGIFSAAAAGTLWDRSVFTVINLLINDSIQFTYVLTANSGG